MGLADVQSMKALKLIKQVSDSLMVETEIAPEEVGNFYLNGLVIMGSAGATYRRSIINIINLSGTLKLPITSDISLYGASSNDLASSPNIVWTANGYNAITTGDVIFKTNLGGVYQPSSNYITVDIDVIKSKYPTTKAIYISTLLTGWFKPKTVKSSKQMVTDLNKLVNPSQITCWGDSLTIGAPVYEPNDYPSKLGVLTRLSIKNYGVGGEKIRTIAGRQGGIPMIVQPTITIPADKTAVQINLLCADDGVVAPLLQVATSEKGLNPCSIDGVEGTLTYNTTDTKYYFTRSVVGSSLTINRPTPLITRAMSEKRNSDITVFWGGANDLLELSDSQIVSKYKLMVDYLQTTSKKYLIIGLPNRNGTNGPPLESLMFDTFGRHYINWRKYVVTYGLSDAGLTPTTADNDAIAQGNVPPSLLSDTIHGTVAYYDILSKQVYKRGQEFGYWS